MARAFDATHLIERLPNFEDRLNIRLQALYATIEGPDSDGEYEVELFGEAHSGNGADIDQSIEITLACYDSKGRVVGTTSYFISDDSFFGFETISLSVYVNAGDIAKLRVFPKPS